MPRDARKIPPEGFLHVISRGNSRRKIFRFTKNKKKYYLYLKKLKKEEYIDICHYCIMDNHIHLLVQINAKSNLSRFMKRVNLKYTLTYHKKYKSCGHLWQGRFQSKIIDNDIYLMQCGKYIELNPVRAGIVSSPEEYQFSSYAHYGWGIKDPIITPNPLYENSVGNEDEKKQDYRNMVIDEEKKDKYTI